MSVHWAGSADLASLVAETQCAERNAPETALTFASKLALFIDRSRDRAGDGEVDEGDILEDAEFILEWHIGHLRGVKVEPLDQTRLHTQAPEFYK